MKPIAPRNNTEMTATQGHHCTPLAGVDPWLDPAGPEPTGGVVGAGGVPLGAGGEPVAVGSADGAGDGLRVGVGVRGNTVGVGVGGASVR